MDIRNKNKDLERIRNFRLMDDDFMVVIFDGDVQTTGYVVNTVLEKSDIEIIQVTVQSEQKNLSGRSIILDVLAQDSVGKYYNIEIQRSDRGAGRHRARYHASILDSKLLSAGDRTFLLPETYVIFITENDVLKKGYSLYHIERIIQEDGEPFEDGEHIIYVNGAYEGNDPIGRLMNDFRVKDPNEMFSDVLKRKSKFFKETEEGQATMCRMMEEMRRESEANATIRVLATLVEQKKISLSDAAQTSQMTEAEFLTRVEQQRQESL